MPRFDPQATPSFAAGAETKATVKWFNPSKGFGFVSPEDGTPDAFLHISALNRIGLHEIGDGAEIRCRIVEGAKGPQVAHILEVLREGAPAAAPRPTGFRDEPAGPQTELLGTVKWFKPDKGFGFVAADDGAKEVFVHKSVLRRSGLTGLQPGQRVLMRVTDAAKGREASWLTLV